MNNISLEVYKEYQLKKRFQKIFLKEQPLYFEGALFYEGTIVQMNKWTFEYNRTNELQNFKNILFEQMTYPSLWCPPGYKEQSINICQQTVKIIIGCLNELYNECVWKEHIDLNL